MRYLNVAYIEYISNAYLIKHNNCALKGGSEMPVGYKNYGENISFEDCTLHNTRGVSVVNRNPNGDFRFNLCSFDYSDKIFECYGGGIIADNSHFEFRMGGENPTLIHNYEVFKCEGGNSKIPINNS